ncbi:hypothetical protein [Paenibacillus sp. MY03]|uniref:hypothetical protein n=1 Tax=Paenibacillus sp. MY03 TaxID=302980 RepID=UPI0015C594BD|nr:hypothetical protein [Paenibacillus sp. MY03]
MKRQSLLQRVVSEKSQLIEHKRHGELAEYGPENYDDLMSLFTDMITHLSIEEEKEHAA